MAASSASHPKCAVGNAMAHPRNRTMNSSVIEGGVGHFHAQRGLTGHGNIVAIWPEYGRPKSGRSASLLEISACLLWASTEDKMHRS